VSKVAAESDASEIATEADPDDRYSASTPRLTGPGAEPAPRRSSQPARASINDAHPLQLGQSPPDFCRHS